MKEFIVGILFFALSAILAVVLGPTMLLGLVLGLAFMLVFFYVSPLYPRDIKDLVTTLLSAKYLLIIDDGLGRYHLRKAILEDGFLKTKEHNFAVGAEGTSRTLCKSRAAIAYVGYGGALNLGVCKAAEKIADAVDEHGSKALNPGVTIKMPSFGIVHPNRVERILHESVSGKALKQLEIAAELRGRAGLTDWGKIVMILVILFIGVAVAMYILNMGFKGMPMPSIPGVAGLPGGGGVE